MKRVWRWSRGLAALIVLGAAVLALPTSSAVAGNATPGQGFIVCPQVLPPVCCDGPPVSAVPQARTALPQCCPVPTAGCCASATTTCCTAATCPQTLSIGVTPDPAADGQNATISGALTGGTVAAQPVEVWEELPGQTAFSDVAQTQTSSSGSFSLVRPVQTNAKWYAEAGTVTSTTVEEPVRATIVLTPSTVRRASRVKLTLSGSIAPSHAGERVAVEQRRGRRWVTIARPKLGALSKFVVHRKLRGSSLDRYRVVLAPDARNARSVSAVVSVRG